MDIFSEAVSAIDARRLGNGLLHKTMDFYPSLSFDCFDRFFPNQYLMPITYRANHLRARSLISYEVKVHLTILYVGCFNFLEEKNQSSSLSR